MGTIKHNKYGYYINAQLFDGEDYEQYQMYLQEISIIYTDKKYNFIHLKDKVRKVFFEDKDGCSLLHFKGSVKSVIKELDALGIEYTSKYIDVEHDMIFDTIEEVERINKYIKDLHVCETYIYF